MEDKIDKLVDILVNYSLKIKEKDRVLITYQSNKCNGLIKKLIKKISIKKAVCMTKLLDQEINSYLLQNTNDKRIKLLQKTGEEEVNNYDVFISIRYNINDYTEKNIDSLITNKINKSLEKVNDIRINQRRWVLLNYPSVLDSHKAKMTIDDFYNYAIETMTIDYEEMRKKLEPLKKLMEKTDKVRILAKNTDITFSIKNMPIIPCTGEMNIPDGEIYTAPIKNSVNGIITYNTPSPYRGNIYNNVSLEFKEGKIIKASSDNDTEKLNEIFDTDEGSKYIGEFSLGINPIIKHPMGDILYDEKIIGSIHFTPGRAYKNADNGNKSSIHWDMVLIQRKEYGGGEIYFDDILIRKDGIFVLDELKELNYNLE